MSGEAKQRGYCLDIDSLRKLAGVAAVRTVASRDKGLLEIMEGVLQAVGDGNGGAPRFRSGIAYSRDIEEAALQIGKNLDRH